MLGTLSTTRSFQCEERVFSRFVELKQPQVGPTERPESTPGEVEILFNEEPTTMWRWLDAQYMLQLCANGPSLGCAPKAILSQFNFTSRDKASSKC
jgi:hypothetical protein